MGRTTKAQNVANNTQQTYMNHANTAFAGNQADIAKFNTNESTLEKGGLVGANPWMSPTYLANQDKLTANATSANNDAAAQALRDQNRRSGGLNNTGTTATIGQMALQKMRLADTLNAQRSTNDFGKNVTYQQELARAPLDAAAAEQGAYGTSTAGQSSALNDMTQFGLNQQGEWYKLLNQGISAIGAGISGAAGGGGLSGALKGAGGSL